MKILWLHQYFATPRGWGAVRTYEFARRFCSRGATVDVVCGAGYDATLKPSRSGATAAGIRVFVSGTPYRPQMGFARRLLSFFSFMGECLAFVLCTGRRYDVLVASSGPLTLAVPALISKWLWGTPFVFEVIDVWPDSAIEAGVLRNPVLKGISRAVERLAYAYASTVVTCSSGMTDRVGRKLGMDGLGAVGAEADTGGRIVTISNCCDLSSLSPDESVRRGTRQRLGVDESQTVFLYTGALGASNAVDDLVEAVHATSADKRAIWWVAGDGRFSREVQEALAFCSRHRYFGSLAKEEVVALYLAADVNVVTFMHAPLFFENSPNKFFDGIAAGLPAVFNRSTWLSPWLDRYGCGLVADSGRDGGRLSDILLGLAADPERRRRMGRGARRLAEEVFSRDRLADTYWRVLCDAAQTRGRGRYRHRADGAAS